MIEGSSRWRRDPGRDHSSQVREFKSLQGGDEWPHWPGKNFLSRAYEVSQATGWLVAESLMFRAQPGSGDFRTNLGRKKSAEVNSRNDLSS